MIGSIVRAKCQEILRQIPEISIDFPTRLALNLVATEAEFNQVIAALPPEIQGTWKLLCPPSQFEGRLYVEMKPILPPPPRDLATEIDKLKVRVEKLEKK